MAAVAVSPDEYGLIRKFALSCRISRVYSCCTLCEFDSSS